MRNLASSDATLEILKIYTLMGFFWPKYIMLDLKITEELCVTTLKGDIIFKEKLTVGLKNQIMNLVSFDASSC